MRQLGRQLRRSDQNRWFGRQPQMMGDLLMMLSPGPGYTFWRARCRFRTRNDRIKSVPSIDQTAGWQCWELIRIPASRVVPPAFRLSPSGWSGYVRCPSGFSLFRKSEGLGIPFVQGDGHRLSANIVLWKADASSCGVMWSAFTSAHKQKLKSLRLGKGEAAWLGSTCCEHQNVAEIFFFGYTTFTGGNCINLTWHTILLMFVSLDSLEGLDYQLVRPPDRQAFLGRARQDHDFW